MASSSCGNTEARAKSLAPARGEKRKKMKVVMPRPHKKLLLTPRKKWEPLPSLDEEFLRNITAIIGTGEQHDAAESGFSLDKYLRLDNMGDVLKAEKDLLAELGEQYHDKGFS